MPSSCGGEAGSAGWTGVTIGSLGGTGTASEVSDVAGVSCQDGTGEMAGSVAVGLLANGVSGSATGESTLFDEGSGILQDWTGGTVETGLLVGTFTGESAAGVALLAGSCDTGDGAGGAWSALPPPNNFAQKLFLGG